MSSAKLLTTGTRQLRVCSPPILKQCIHHRRRSLSKITSLPRSYEFIKVSSEIQTALERGAPVVALESANITCPREVGALPYPTNAEYASRVEREIRKMGAIPATMMVLAGKVHVGIEDPDLYRDMLQRGPMKVSQRDLPFVLGMPGRRSGGLTVSAALTIASIVGIKVLATGAIGGVHRSATTLLDISADVHELGRRNVAVVCSGPKVYLDSEGTIEYLETKGVPVATFARGAMGVKLPAHYSREGLLQSPLVVNDALDAARLIYISHKCELETGQLLCNPIPYEYSLGLEATEKSVHRYFKERKKHSKKDKEVVEKIMSSVRHFHKQRAVEAEKAILMNNARMAANVAVELARLETGIDWTSKAWTQKTEDEMNYRESSPNHSRVPQDKEVQRVYQPGKGYLPPLRPGNECVRIDHPGEGYLPPVRTVNEYEQRPQEQRPQEQQKHVPPIIRRSLSRDPLSDYQKSQASRQPLQRPHQFPREPQQDLEKKPLHEPVPRTETVTERGFTIRRGAYLGGPSEN